MKKNQDELIDILLKLRTEYCANSLKAESFEDLSNDDIAYLKFLADEANMNFTLKVGGSEAYRDTKFAAENEIKKLVVPMIESSYALEKFISIVEEVYSSSQFPEIYANIETNNGVSVLADILKSDNCNKINGIIFGRTDMCGSLGLTCKDVDNDEIYHYALDISNQIKAFGKLFYIGGRVSPNSIPFFKKLPYLNGFETKKILFNSKVLEFHNPENAIMLALQFELLWLQSKKQTMCDKRRIEIIKRRIAL